jgi:alpha-amylase
MNSTRQNYWGDNLLGARGNDEFFHPEVVAANKFRKAMNGQKEDIQVSDNGQVLVVNRGNKGAAIINISDSANFVDLPTGLPNGTYKDVVYGYEFRVKAGKLHGAAAPHRTYLLQRQ